MKEFGPKAVTDQENWRCAGLSVFSGERTAQERRDGERFKCAGSDQAAGEIFNGVTESEVNVLVNQAKHVIEGVVVLLEIDEGRGGKAPGAELIAGKNSGGGEPLRVFVGIRMEENAIDDAIDGGGCTDAKSESKDGDSGESGGFAELTKTVTAIAEDGVQPAAEALLADLFFDLLDAA